MNKDVTQKEFSGYLTDGTIAKVLAQHDGIRPDGQTPSKFHAVGLSADLLTMYYMRVELADSETGKYKLRTWRLDRLEMFVHKHRSDQESRERLIGWEVLYGKNYKESE